MKKKDIMIISISCIIISVFMIFFHSRKNSIVLLDKNEITKNSNEDIEILKKSDDVINKKVVVYISGEVQNPQVIELNQGDRLIDAIEKCSGMTDEADKNAINLALVLKDEGHYIIPKKGENLQINSSNNSSFDDSSLININTADKQSLMQLPGFGEKTAEKIIQHRENAPFENIEDLKNVSGIGDKKFEQVKDLISVK